MTPERRVEVNRVLFRYEYPETLEGRLLDAAMAITAVRQGESWPPDYCTDLNAVARLEGKLLRHGWHFGYDPSDVPPFIVSCSFDDFDVTVEEATEAEARAEAIARYLLSRKEAAE